MHNQHSSCSSWKGKEMEAPPRKTFSPVCQSFSWLFSGKKFQQPFKISCFQLFFPAGSHILVSLSTRLSQKHKISSQYLHVQKSQPFKAGFPKEHENYTVVWYAWLCLILDTSPNYSITSAASFRCVPLCLMRTAERRRDLSLWRGCNMDSLLDGQ